MKQQVFYVKTVIVFFIYIIVYINILNVSKSANKFINITKKGPRKYK
jgi:hypothetical protein